VNQIPGKRVRASPPVVTLAEMQFFLVDVYKRGIVYILYTYIYPGLSYLYWKGIRYEM
jgi:hypothetical protein